MVLAGPAGSLRPAGNPAVNRLMPADHGGAVKLAATGHHCTDPVRLPDCVFCGGFSGLGWLGASHGAGRPADQEGVTMEYIITFGDVMAGVIALAIGLLTWFAKRALESIQRGIQDVKNEMKENHDKVNTRIDKLEDETDADIASIREEINNIKGDFATTFVLREDFFRSMNSVEDKMKSIDSKIDKLLVYNNGRQ